MLELIVADEVFSLGVLAAAGAAEQEVNVWLGEEAFSISLFLSEKRVTCDWLHPMHLN